MDGVIMRGIGGLYTVRDAEQREYPLRAQGKFRKQKVKPLVGDWVSFEPGVGEEDGWITAIAPRRTEMIRPPVANIDVLVLVIAASSPQPDLLLVDQLVLLGAMSGIASVVVINKCDENPEGALSLKRQYEGVTLGVYPLSAATGAGVPPLREALCGKIHAFAGQSGVGKSTLINALYGLKLKTGDLSEKIERGKHTTRHCELIPVVGGGMVLDTPGFSLIDLPLIDPERLVALYPEFEGAICRFTPCAHIAEPDCEVRSRLQAGTIDAQRYERYVKLYTDMKERWKNRYD